MRKKAVLFIAICLALGLSAHAADVKAPNPEAMRLELRDAYAQPAQAGGSSAIRALLVNPTAHALKLVGATTPLADQTLLQTYANSPQGLAQVRPLRGLDIPARSEVVLLPGVLELQLVGLKTDLQPGLELPLKLKFDDGTERMVRIAIEGDGNE